MPIPNVSEAAASVFAAIGNELKLGGNDLLIGLPNNGPKAPGA